MKQSTPWKQVDKFTWTNGSPLCARASGESWQPEHDFSAIWYQNEMQPKLFLLIISYYFPLWKSARLLPHRNRKCEVLSALTSSVKSVVCVSYSHSYSHATNRYCFLLLFLEPKYKWCNKCRGGKNHLSASALQCWEISFLGSCTGLWQYLQEVCAWALHALWGASSHSQLTGLADEPDMTSVKHNSTKTQWIHITWLTRRHIWYCQ